MNKLVLLAMFLTLNAFANPLDSLVDELNYQLNPKTINGVGYEADWRENRRTDKVTYVWVNVSEVQLVCSKETFYYAEKGVIKQNNETKCKNKLVSTPYSLLEIFCSGNMNKCIDSLAKNVKVKTVIEMINRGIDQVEVK